MAGSPAWYATDDELGPRNGDELYAVNVGAARTWAVTYPGLPLIEIDGMGVRCVRRSPVTSPDGVLVAGDDLAFVISGTPRAAGHYGLTRARIVDGLVEVTGTEPLLLPDGSRPSSWMRGRICRDNRMWMRFDDPRTWYVVEI